MDQKKQSCDLAEERWCWGYCNHCQAITDIMMGNMEGTDRDIVTFIKGTLQNVSQRGSFKTIATEGSISINFSGVWFKLHPHCG